MKKTQRILSVILALALIMSCLGINGVMANSLGEEFKYYCGFENYSEQIEGISLDSKVASIINEGAYKGSKALKLTLADKGITAFELRDANPFDIVAGKEYEISFAYKASGNIELSAGLAEAGNVTRTADVTESKTLAVADDWQTSVIKVTADKSSSEGYVLAFTVYSAISSEIYFDDVTITYKSEGSVPLGEIDFGFTAENTFPTLNVFDKTESDDSADEEESDEIVIWDKTVAESFEKGSGTESDPYLISTPQELALAITQSGTTTTTNADTGASETVNEPYYGSHYKLTADIHLNEPDAIDWKNASGEQSGLNTWYNYSENFAGTIDGNGHVVYGLYYYVSGTIKNSLSTGRNGSGLIPQAAGANLVKISNLGIDCSYVRDRYTAAAFIANGAGTISNCYAGENVKIEGKDIGAFVGRAYTNNVNLTNCVSFATVYGNSYSFYGLVGQVYQSKTTIKNCYNANGPLASYSNGNYSTWYKFYNSYETVTSGNATYDDSHNIKTNIYTISADQMQGTDVFLTESKMPYLALNTDGSANGAYIATESYPVLSVFPRVSEDDDENESAPEITYDIWDGTKTAPKDSDGDGIYEITKGSELAYIIVNHGVMKEGDVTKEDCNFILTNDIYLNDINKINWLTGEFATDYTPKSWFGNSNYFAGTIDGNGYTVHGLFFVNSAINAKAWAVSGVGLVPRVLWGDSVTIKNLGIDHAYIHTDSGTSAFVGCGGTKNDKSETYAEITVEQCYAGKDVTLVGHSVGVFRGAGRCSNTYIRNCYSLATIESKSDNGLVAMTWDAPATIEKSFNANGTLVTSTTNKVTITDSYQTTAGEYTKVTAPENMKGSDVLTNEAKMPLLSSELFSASEKTFADHDFFVYLPAGTTFAEKLDATFYNELFIQLDEAQAISDNTMLQGAYVKFASEPDESKITLPFELKDYVRYGTRDELFLTNPYYGVKLDFITDNLEKDGDAIKYAFVTDIHYLGGEDVPRALSTIRQLENLVSYVNENDDIDFVAIGGDTIQGTQSKEGSLGYLKKAFKPFLNCNKPVVIVPGNHDDNSYAYDTKTFNGSQLITDKNWNDSVIDVYVNRETANGDVIDVAVSQDEKDENSKYFYYDLDNKKTRVICLDSINYEQTYDENGNLTVDADGNVGLAVRNEDIAVNNYNRYYSALTYWGYGARQMEWLAEEALQAGDDWNYVFISHMGIDEDTNFNEGAVITHYGKNLREIIAAYQFKTAYVNAELGISVDFSETKGRIISYQYGHVHNQKALYSADVDLWQLAASTAQKRNGCFDIMAVSDSVIKRYGIGADYDQTLLQTKCAISGDVNLDGTANVCDLVKLHKVVDGADVKTTSADADKNGLLDMVLDILFVRSLLIGA